MDQGAQESLPGAGNQRSRHNDGDIVVQFEHLPHPLYTVASNGIDLMHTAYVPLVDAILGFGSVYSVSTRHCLLASQFLLGVVDDARKTLLLPSGEKLEIEQTAIAFSGATMTYLMKGLPDVENPSNLGSLIVQFKVQFPRCDPLSPVVTSM